jgi:hypothetical protein
MKIRDIRRPRAYYDMQVHEETHRVELRGLTASDLMMLVTHYGPNLAKTFETLMPKARAKTLTENDVKTALLAALRDAPDMVGNLIALANDDYTEEGREAACGMPLEDQIGMLNVILQETFSSEASVKKLVESLRETYLMISGTLVGIKFPSQNGIGESGAP